MVIVQVRAIKPSRMPLLKSARPDWPLNSQPIAHGSVRRPTCRPSRTRPLAAPPFAGCCRARSTPFGWWRATRWGGASLAGPITPPRCRTRFRALSSGIGRRTRLVGQTTALLAISCQTPYARKLAVGPSRLRLTDSFLLLRTELSWSVPGGFIDVTEVQIEYWQYSKSNIPEEENALGEPSVYHTLLLLLLSPAVLCARCRAVVLCARSAVVLVCHPPATTPLPPPCLFVCHPPCLFVAATTPLPFCRGSPLRVVSPL